VQAEPAQAPPAQAGNDGPPRGLIIAAVALTLAAITAVLVFAGLRRTPPAPVAVAAVPAPQAESPECQALLATLPDRLGDYTRADTARPTPPGTAAWRDAGESGGEPVILRCGLNRPAEFVIGSPLQLVDRVQWFRLEDPQSPLTTWLCVDRAVYVALTLPSGSGPAPIQTMSDVIDRTMPAIPIRPAPAR
jgi:hypothetical protein